MENNKIRIAQIVGNATTGGVISCVLNFYRNIDRTHFVFDFYSYGPSKFDDEIKSLGGNVFYIPKAIRPISHILKLKKLLRKGNYDIVHAHLTTLSVVSLFAAKLAKIKVRICHAHSTTHKREKVKIIKDMLRPWSRTFTTHTAGCSELAIQWLYGKKGAKDSFLLHNAINLNRFKPDSKMRELTKCELGIEKDFIFGTVGRLVYQKNYKFLIDAFALFAKNNPDGKLILVGDGEEKAELIKRINDYKLNNRIQIISEATNIQKYYSAFDCFVLPSRFEGLPLVAVEAQAMNVPCILSSEITKETDIGATYSFVDINNPELWANAMQDVYEKHPHYDIHEQLIGSNFDIQSETKRLENYYASLVV